MRKTLPRLWLVAFFASFFALSTQTSMACMYGPPYRTVCHTYAEADAVIIGHIESVRGDLRQKVVVNVVETFKGKEQKVFVLDQPQSSCDWDFSLLEGKKVLIYLVRDKKTGSFSAIAQGMGGLLEKVSDDLSWLRGLPASLKRTRIAGDINIYRNEPFEFLRYAAGTKVKIHNSDHSFEVTTDENGLYELWDIPVGKYQVDPVLPSYLSLKFPLPKGLVDFDSLKKKDPKTEDVLIEIVPGGCGGIDFVVNEKSNN